MEKYGFIRMLFNKGNTLYDYSLCVCVCLCVYAARARVHIRVFYVKIYVHARWSCMHNFKCM